MVSPGALLGSPPSAARSLRSSISMLDFVIPPTASLIPSYWYHGSFNSCLSKAYSLSLV